VSVFGPNPNPNSF